MISRHALGPPSGVPLVVSVAGAEARALIRGELARMGYRMVLYPVSGLRAALKATRAVLEDIAGKGHQRDRLGDMLTRAELYDLLGYDGYDSRDRSYFG